MTNIYEIGNRIIHFEVRKNIGDLLGEKSAWSENTSYMTVTTLPAVILGRREIIESVDRCIVPLREGTYSEYPYFGKKRITMWSFH